MFHFFLKRAFVRDVQTVVGESFKLATIGSEPLHGIHLKRDEFLKALSEWLDKENYHLNCFTHSSMSETGIAIHRAKVWVGVFLVMKAYEQGLPGVPTKMLRKFYRPSKYIADVYFEKIISHAPSPFTSAFHEKFDEAIS